MLDSYININVTRLHIKHLLHLNVYSHVNINQDYINVYIDKIIITLPAFVLVSSLKMH